MAIWARRGERLGDLVHHSDRGVQYLAIVYSTRLEEAGVAPSVGSKGDSYDNALAESINASYKAECIERLGPWRDNMAPSRSPPPSGSSSTTSSASWVPSVPHDAGRVRGRLLGGQPSRHEAELPGG